MRSIAACALLAAASPLASAQDAVAVDPSRPGPRFQGWGTSLAWWANVVGGWGNQGMLDRVLDENFNVETGLGLNIVRFNIGGGQNPNATTVMSPGRGMPGYQHTEGAPFDFEADANQQRILLEAIERGVNLIEANGNSPPWWMTNSLDVSGAPNGAENLPASRRDDYGRYLATVSAYLRDELGVHLSSVTPLNEPSAWWWNGQGNQEGCVIPASSQPFVLANLRIALDAAGLREVPLSGPEEWSSDLSYTSLNSYPSFHRSLLGHITTHTYGDGRESQLNAMSEQLDVPLWVSEYGNGGTDELDSAMQLAGQIIEDFRQMPRVSAWVIWQTLSETHFQHYWACMLTNFQNPSPGYLMRIQHYAYMQFTRWIRPGSHMLPTTDSGVLAAYDPARGRLTLVSLNSSANTRVIALDLSGFEALGSTARVYQTGATDRHANITNTPVRSSTFTIALRPRTVTTIVMDATTQMSSDADRNGDGAIDASDVQGFLSELASGAESADVNDDYAVDAFDMIEVLRDLAIAGG